MRGNDGRIGDGMSTSTSSGCFGFLRFLCLRREWLGAWGGRSSSESGLTISRSGFPKNSGAATCSSSIVLPHPIAFDGGDAGCYCLRLVRRL